MLKLSGEVFGGGKLGVDPDVVAGLAKQIGIVVQMGVQVAVVVGGGNFFRGAELQQHGMERDRADYMGMLGTVMNCLALQDFLEKVGVQTRVQTAITMGQWRSRTFPAARSGILRRVGSSSSARALACPISPLTPWPLSEPSKSAPRCC